MDSKPSAIFIPYISSDNISHIYYGPNVGTKEPRKSNYFSSGLYERKPEENQFAYAKIAEPLLLYDKVYITLDDFFYLTTCITDYDFFIQLFDKDELALIDTNSARFSHYYDNSSGQYRVQADLSGLHGKAGFRRQLEVLPERLMKRVNRQIIHVPSDEDLIKNVVDSSNDDLCDKRIIHYLNFDGRIGDRGICLDSYKRNRIHYMHYFLALQRHLNIPFMFQDEVLYDLMNFKLSHVQTKARIEDSLYTLLDFENVINIRTLVQQGKLSMDNLLKIKYSKDTAQFRDWICNANTETKTSSLEGYELLKHYHNACLERGKLEKLAGSIPYKLISLALTNIPIPFVSFPLSLADTFKDILVAKWKPNYFFDNVRRRISK